MKCHVEFTRRFWISNACFSAIFGRAVLLALSLLFASLGAEAQVALGPTASAMGGAGRAAVDLGEVSWLNPATLTQMNGYYIGLNGSIEDHAVDGNVKQYAILAAENEPDELVAGSFSYVHTNIGRASGNLADQEFQIALAGRVLSRLSIGASVHRLAENVAVGPNQTQYNGTLGLLWTPLQSLGVALVAYDLVPEGSSVPSDLRLTPSFAAGINWLAQDFLHLRLDLSRPSEGASGRMDVMAGFETILKSQFALRLGNDWKETANENWFTAGFGLLGPKLSFDYAFQKDTRQAEGYRHSVDLWMPF